MAANRERSKHLTIRNDIADLAIVRDGLGRFCMEHDISRKTIMQLQVTLDELISNVIKYAWPAGGRHELSVRMTATAKDLRIDLVDDGQAFDPRTAQPPEGSARRRRPGGVGIHMVKQLVDDI